MKSKREISKAELGELRAMIRGKGKIPEYKLLNAMDSSNLVANYVAHRIVTESYLRVHPELDLLRVGEFLLDYYLACIQREPPPEPEDDAELRDDELYRPCEAGRLLIGFVVNMWRLRPETDALIDDCVQRVTDLYLKSNENIRLCIETAFLEHVFERPVLRPLFAHWADHPELAGAHRLSVEWGLRFERPDA